VIDRPNLGVDGTVTVRLSNGKHFTYRLETVKRGALEGNRIVSLLIGPDNERSYKGFAFINESGDEGEYNLNVWRKCRGERYDKHALILSGMAKDHVDEYLQAGRCQICGRKLTTPESIKAGIGPVCREKGNG
jgi:hypothetical protein